MLKNHLVEKKSKTQEFQLVQELRNWEGAWEAEICASRKAQWQLGFGAGVSHLGAVGMWVGCWEAGIAPVAWTFNKGRKSGSRSMR